MADQSAAELAPGTLVLCQYRLPSIVQPWLHDFHVGVIEEAGTDPAEWNSTNSEQEYCAITGRARVRYPFGVQYDSIRSLIPLTPEQAALPGREKISLFLGEQALKNYDRAFGLVKGETDAPPTA